MSDALRLYRLRTKAMKEALGIDADVESDSEVDNGLSAFDGWENQIITLSEKKNLRKFYVGHCSLQVTCTVQAVPTKKR